jgi:hypothetical protein
MLRLTHLITQVYSQADSISKVRLLGRMTFTLHALSITWVSGFMLITLLMYSVRVPLSIVGAGYVVDCLPRIRIHASVHRMVLTGIGRTCPLQYFVPAIFLFSVDRGLQGSPWDTCSSCTLPPFNNHKNLLWWEFK